MTFTPQKPTVPGAYYTRHEASGIRLPHPEEFSLDSQNRLRDHMGRLLNGDWYDGWEFSPRLVPVYEVEQWKLIADNLAEELGMKTPDSHCGCHVSPPCNDCVKHSASREALEKYRARRVVEGKEEV